MELNNLIQMSISSWENYINDDDVEIAVGKVCFLSNRPNTHKHRYSEDIIKRDSKSVLGKFVVAKYDKYENDVQGHNKDEVIVGYVPASQSVKFNYDTDGYLVASVDVAISKLYATEVYELFKTKNYKSVSIEEMVRFTQDTESIIDGMAEKDVDGFNITGITILGNKYNPSVPNANITLTRMSENLTNEFENEYAKYSELHKEIDKIDIVLSKLESIEEKLSKEKDMAEFENNEAEIVENSTEEVVENANEETEPTEVDNACGEDEKSEDMEEVDNGCGEDEEEVENSCDSEPETNAEEDAKDDKIQEMSEKLSEAESKIASYEVELAELRSFKENIENSEKEEIANQTLAKVEKFITSEEYAEYKNQFESCSYSDVNGLRNSILAKYFDKVSSMNKESEDSEIKDLGMPIEAPKKYNSIYD